MTEDTSSPGVICSVSSVKTGMPLLLKNRAATSYYEVFSGETGMT